MNKQSTFATVRSLGNNQDKETLAQTELHTLLAQCIAEALGAFGLVFAGCGAIMINELSKGQVTHVGIGLVFGLIITVMISAFGHISGAHFNPAVTLAFALTRHFPIKRLPLYWASQLVGATLATLLLFLLLGDVASLGLTLPLAGDEWQSVGMEIILTFFLMVVIMSMTTDTRAVGKAAALAIGATIMLEAIFGGPISGASMNPARSLAPAIITGKWTSQWIYLVGPFLGAIGGAFVYRYLREASMPSPQTLDDDEKEKIQVRLNKTASLREWLPPEMDPKESGEKDTWQPTTDSLTTAQQRSTTTESRVVPLYSQVQYPSESKVTRRTPQMPVPSESQVTPLHSQRQFSSGSKSTSLYSQTPSSGNTSSTSTRPMRILFLSTHNAVRSQMAEGLLRLRGGRGYEVFSAGSYPTSVHPLAIQVMEEIGIDTSPHRAKWVEEFTVEPPMDLVITICDDSNETCPSFSKTRWQAHWSLPDPSQINGSEEERLTAFRLMRDLIAAKVNQFPSHNPLQSPEQFSAQGNPSY
jgi:MIP family channel proteins